LSNEQLPQLIVPSKHWFAAEVVNKNEYALVGCTVAPGFNFNDFELASRQKLIRLFPKHKQIITKFAKH